MKLLQGLGLIRLISYVSSANVLQFENLGYSGTYNPVSALNDIYSDQCSCDSGNPVQFSGVTSPLDDQLSVHFRGPLILHKFGVYYSSNFELDNDNSQAWERIAYYDGEQGTANNVTFLTNDGRESNCLGKGLAYACPHGLQASETPNVLDGDTLISSNEEFIIFSGETCGSSSLNGDCKVYRDDIPAYKGFDGRVKMFLFEFEMPQESKYDEDHIHYNAPAIWLLNAQIPRTSQYSMNSTCSCWASGCGEFDIFEIMNNTDSTSLLSTIHNYQGTNNVNQGIVIPGSIERSTTEVMKGGVFFDNDGNAVVFMSDNTSMDDNISARNVNSWVREAGSSGNSVVESLSSVSFSPANSRASSSQGAGHKIENSMTSRIGLAFFGLLFWFV